MYKHTAPHQVQYMLFEDSRRKEGKLVGRNDSFKTLLIQRGYFLRDTTTVPFSCAVF